ncbi:hypothetical protein [Actinomadura rayongensis]|uniref:DUF3558 domain-containing protein n=1 Tax=Actinomadura rayongensis TaxID=1429076 RepID=A0A6I4W2Q4_9ACTN|nr:hypothetical protein [Actinomadura rayongensis]MXQ62685.1 hypothetical protein [Actinomadura rayongensis]
MNGGQRGGYSGADDRRPQGAGDSGPYGRPYGAQESGPHHTPSSPSRATGGSRHAARSSRQTRRTGTGGHRVAGRRRQRRGGRGAVIAGVAVGIAACAGAAIVLLTGAHVLDDGRVGGDSVAARTPLARADRADVPDACTVFPADLAGRLAPGADRTPADNYQASDRQNQCVWGVYTGDRKRLLTVELRAIAPSGGGSAASRAAATLRAERTADESGRSLVDGQRLTGTSRIRGLGEDNYVVTSQDSGDGSASAVTNVRVGNVLVTVRYGGTDRGRPLATAQVVSGAEQAARAAIGELGAR